MREITGMVEDSSAATEEMAAQAGQVTSSIESIAAIAEENSAEADTVSSSATSMSEQIEAMYAQAEELASTAEQLRLIVGRFRFEAGRSAASRGAASQVVTRRRADDWQPAEPATRRRTAG